LTAAAAVPVARTLPGVRERRAPEMPVEIDEIEAEAALTGGRHG